MNISADETGQTNDLTRNKVARAQATPRIEGFHFKLSKRIFDVLFAFIALVLAAPLLVIVALAVCLDSPGPVLFRQTRTGLKGRTFKIYKIRTMCVAEDGSCVREVARDDPRITRLGRVLRKTSIDELPQLWNVVRGEMSLVGPRPHAVVHDEYYGQRVPGYWRRFEVRPGLTGWAQINNSRGSINEVSDMIKRVELDLWYIGNRSFWLDMSIIARTVYLEIIRKTDAY